MRRRGGKDLPQPLIAGISVVYYATPERMFVKNTRGKYRDKTKFHSFLNYGLKRLYRNF